MDATRCPKCNKRLIEEADGGDRIEHRCLLRRGRHSENKGGEMDQLGAGRIELRCLNCDAVDPLKTKGAKWAESSLAQPPGS